MTDEECIHGLTAQTCGVCKHGITSPQAPWGATGHTATAQYEASCAGCDGTISPGDRIGRQTPGGDPDAGAQRWTHEACS